MAMYFFSIIYFLNVTALENTYFATSEMVAKRLCPVNLYGKQYSESPYSYSRDQLTSKGKWKINADDEARIITKITVSDILDVLERCQADRFFRLVEVTQEIRKLFLQKDKKRIY